MCKSYDLILMLQILCGRLISSQPATPALLQKYVAAELSQVCIACKIGICKMCINSLQVFAD